MNLKRTIGLTTALGLVLVATSQAVDTKPATQGYSKTVIKKKGCCAKGAKTVATKDDAKNAKTASAKKGRCSKSGKNAKTVAVKDTAAKYGKKTSAKKGCCSKGAKSAKAVALKKDGADTTKSKSAKKGCCSKGAKSAKTVASKSPCSAKCGKDGSLSGKVASVLASLPEMTYRVGKFTTACPMEAAAKAESDDDAITYVVGDKIFKNKGEAKVALAALLEERVDEMTHIQFVAGKECFKCPMTAKTVAKKSKSEMKYRVGGIDFDSEKRAKLAAERVAKAVAGIKMTYMADGKVVGCPKSCKGKKVTYVVGDEKTSCDKSASLMLAERKIRTIVETAASL